MCRSLHQRKFYHNLMGKGDIGNAAPFLGTSEQLRGSSCVSSLGKMGVLALGRGSNGSN